MSASYTNVDLDNWERQQHFAFFKDFQQPYFNVCVSLRAEPLYDYCRAQQKSFFLAYLYLAHISAAEYWPMGLRIVDGRPVHCADPSISVVQLAQDDTFRFSYLPSAQGFSEYCEQHRQARTKALQQPLFSEGFAESEGRCDLIHVSVLPWLNFSAFSHATHEGNASGVPKLVFGQYDKGTGSMTLSLDVHHALMDGLHSGQFIGQLQQKFRDPQRYLSGDLAD
ncbi:CatA-like O-acetyltransferase [Pseudoalteromonas sp. BDTF-M6]|uniref:CatA-like O-acetyltransferase n=1 Tax=Pseudoalteromonas sp. BDTF-M6 TaxID=2796132 RepID=UPI001BAFD31A|nr:CatA-like O-acetyltransferase [Pseudoalteromonas sp. BDTF-M6]MBS3796447.1 chloramphenicol acetyltransferase [Pseudoalteromonas sp. BDTF-M6]